MGESSKMLLLGLLLAIAGTSEASTVIDGGPCPENWIDASFAGMGCLFFNTTEVTTWEEASVSCYLSNNSTLVEIWTELQLDFLRSELTLLANTGVWTRWWTSGTDFVWYPGQPARGHLENCSYFDQWQDFMIGDIGCGVKSNIYPICQIK